MNMSDVTEILEINFEVVSYIQAVGERNEKIQHIETMQGIGGLYELAEELTLKFFNLTRSGDDDGYGLKDGEFFERLEEFLYNELN